MKLKIILSFAGLLVLLGGGYFYCGSRGIIFPIVISDSTPISQNFKIGDSINPLTGYDFSSGNWTAYLIIDPADFEDLDSVIPRARCLRTSDPRVLESMKSAWNFKYTQADLATVTSNFLLFSEGKLVFKTGVVLDKNSVGLQAENFGWVKALDPEAVVKSVEKFQIVKLPPIIL